MHSTLCEAVARCQLRRLRRRRRRGAVAGRDRARSSSSRRRSSSSGSAVRSVTRSPERRGSAASPMPSCSGRCSRLPSPARRSRSRAPARSALGHQIAAGPCGRAVAVVALPLVPALAGALVVLPSLVAVCVGLARALPGGVARGPCARGGNARRRSGRRGRRRGRDRCRRAAASPRARDRRRGRSWAALGLVARCRAARAARARHDRRSAARAPPGSPSACRLARDRARLSPGSALAAAAREPRSRASGRRGARPGGRLPAPVAAAALLARRSDLRLRRSGRSRFGLAGVALAAAAAAPSPAPFLLGTTTALLGSLLCPLVVGGALARWPLALAERARRPRASLVRAAALAGFAAAALPVAVVGAAAAVVSGAHPGIVGIVAALVVVGSAGRSSPARWCRGAARGLGIR